MKGLSQACVLYAKLLLHGVYKDLEKLQSKKTAAERQALVFKNATVEEQFMQTLESRVHAWLAAECQDVDCGSLLYVYPIGMNMSKSVRVTGVEVLGNIEETSIQINYEVTEGFKFHQDLLVSQAFGTQKISDEDVLKYFEQTEEKIHSMDTRKPSKFPDRSPPSKTHAINTPDLTKAEGEGKS